MKKIYSDKRGWKNSRDSWVSFESDPKLRVTKRNINGRCVQFVINLSRQLQEEKKEVELKEAYHCWKVVGVIAFAGFDPSVHQSGQFEGMSKISKRGNRHLRQVIFLMTTCVMRGNNIFTQYFLTRKAEKLPSKKAILAAAHKLVRVLFTILTTKSYIRKEVVEV